MLELAILGFLAGGPLHGYELRRRVTRLSGYTRPVSDGSLYPAINRMLDRGLLDRRVEPGAAAAQRYVLSLTDAGRAELLQRLRKPADHEITDSSRFFTILAFLSLLPATPEQHAVLRRRLEFLEEPASSSTRASARCVPRMSPTPTAAGCSWSPAPSAAPNEAGCTKS